VILYVFGTEAHTPAIILEAEIFSTVHEQAIAFPTTIEIRSNTGGGW